ncbi:MAG TPA: DUF4870 domain-containing protein [Puia sp.]|jgi:uncharacterized Tic20 family protein
MSEERLLALLSHILAIVPGIGILGPLVIYLVKKDESSFVRDNALESLNFQLTIILLYILAGILVLVFIGIFLFWVIGIMNAVLVIVATVRASEGQVYRYPVNLRLIK